MLTLPPGARLLLATSRVDGRKGINGLSTLVRSQFSMDPLSGMCLCFSRSGRTSCASFIGIATVTCSGTRLREVGEGSESDGRIPDIKGRTRDPVVGKFLQPDPAVTEPYTVQGFNRYRYVNNNPLAAQPQNW